MKLIGKVYKYNDKYGIIVTSDETVSFERKDISCNQTIRVGDRVEFRLETRFPDVKIARNINRISND